MCSFCHKSLGLCVQDLAQEQGISAMPTFLFFKNGVKVQSFVWF